MRALLPLLIPILTVVAMIAIGMLGEWNERRIVRKMLDDAKNNNYWP